MIFHMIKAKTFLSQSVKLKRIGNLPPSKQSKLIVRDFAPPFTPTEDPSNQFLVVAFGKGERLIDEILFGDGS